MAKGINGQGALEYLLLIAGAVLVVAIVITIVSSMAVWPGNIIGKTGNEIGGIFGSFGDGAPPTDACNIDSDCDDSIGCTIDICSGTPKICHYNVITTCINNDDCCPMECDNTTDNDCSAVGECTTPTDCEDGIVCTIDECSGMPLICHSTPIVSCADGDDCCPVGCNETASTLDNDCAAYCGNLRCETGENCASCPQDCGSCPPAQTSNLKFFGMAQHSADNPQDYIKKRMAQKASFKSFVSKSFV